VNDTEANAEDPLCEIRRTRPLPVERRNRLGERTIRRERTARLKCHERSWASWLSSRGL